MSETKDYFEILGVPKGASADQIKVAYRALAMKYHPDRNKSAAAESKMKEINEAYDILSDDLKRTSYQLKTGFKNNQQHNWQYSWQFKQKDKVTGSKTWSTSEDEFLYRNFLSMSDTVLAANLGGKSRSNVRQRKAYWGLIRPRIIKKTSREPRVQRIVLALRRGQKIFGSIRVAGGNNDIYFGTFNYEGRVNSFRPRYPEMIRNLKSFGLQIGNSGNYCFYFSNSFSLITSKSVEFSYNLENGRKMTLSFVI